MTFRAGIIGAGGIAGLGILGLHDEEDIGQKKFEASHAGGYRSTNDIDIVAVADPDKEKRERFGAAWDLEKTALYSDHHSMLDSEDLDVVSVCTPTYLHHDHVVDAARSSASPTVIWCEKPIASSVTEANQMSQICAEEDVELVINHSFRFTEKIQELRNLIADGLIGDVRSISSQFRRELLRNSTHLIDTLVFFLDARAEKVSGYINGENDAVDALEGNVEVDDSGGGGIVIMDDGTFATIDCTVAREISSMSYHFIGTEGKLYLNNDDAEWRYWSLEDGEHVERPIPGLDGSWTWEEDYRSSFPNAAQHVEDILTGSAENISTGKAATRSLEIIVGFYLSHYTDSHIDIPLDRPLRDVTITSW